MIAAEVTGHLYTPHKNNPINSGIFCAQRPTAKHCVPTFRSLRGNTNATARGSKDIRLGGVIISPPLEIGYQVPSTER